MTKRPIVRIYDKWYEVESISTPYHDGSVKATLILIKEEDDNGPAG